MKKIIPDWPAPENINAFCTTRQGGISGTPFDTFNIAGHVNDSPESIFENRKRLLASLPLQTQLQWLNQVHGNNVVCADENFLSNPDADASYARESNNACVVMTADCLPILLCDKQGRQVAALHAGWRSLAAGIIENTVATFENMEKKDVLAWFGPAIGPDAFEVGQDVFDVFIKKDTNAVSAFKQISQTKWLANIYQLAKIELNQRGITQIYGGDFCTFNEPSRFYSYRRDGQTGRMASLIYINT